MRDSSPPLRRQFIDLWKRFGYVTFLFGIGYGGCTYDSQLPERQHHLTVLFPLLPVHTCNHVLDDLDGLSTNLPAASKPRSAYLSALFTLSSSSSSAGTTAIRSGTPSASVCVSKHRLPQHRPGHVQPPSILVLQFLEPSTHKPARVCVESLDLGDM
jgi:hypothetical protein